MTGFFMDRPITIRTGRRVDIPAIVDLLRSALGETPLLRRTSALFEWKHYDNPFGQSLILLAEDAGRLLGVRALMRWDLMTPDSHTIRCLRAVDTATDPQSQGKGIFRRLTMAAVEQARDEGIDLIFNTPNEKSAPGYLKMGWNEVGWFKPVLRPRLGRSIKTPVNAVPLLDDAVPGVESFVADGYHDRPSTGLRTVRTNEYYKWRFLLHPTARYGWVRDPIQGGAVVRASVRRGRVETVISDLLNGGVNGAVGNVVRQHRTRYVASSFASSTPEMKAVRKGGLFPVPGLSGLHLVANQLTRFDFPVFEIASWDFAISDLELL